MKNKCRFTLLLFVIIPFLLKAQIDKNSFSNCLTDQLHQKMSDENAYYSFKHQKIEQQLYKLKNQTTFSSSKSLVNQSIPVVVHIIHQNGPENITDEQVFDGIQHLNNAFANIGFYNPNTGVDTEIDFCLAIRDPQNNSTNGINRIASELTNLTMETQDQDLKALLQWNSLEYLNIWIVNEITSLSSGSGVAGYATYPAAHGLPEDGIVIEARFTGSSENNSKVLVHEAGHYLGLYHTFEGGCSNDDCQTNGDRVCDTPPDQSTAPVACGAVINTCSTDDADTSINNPFRPIALGGLGDQNDMYINYMDYGHLPCYSAFTMGQKERMKNALSTTRQSLLDSYVCQPPCPLASYNASFTYDPPTILVGELVQFTNSSDPANFYEWSIDNQTVSNTQNSNYTFTQEGLYTVNLLIRDTTNNCESSFEQIIEVICEGEASFTTTSTEIQAGDTLNFINTSSDHIGYEWFLDGVLYSSSTDINIIFTDPGYYSLYLVGTTATCLNYASTVTIIVGSCVGEDKSKMHWYFGENAALDFNSGDPVNVSGSQLDASEGTGCISDENGDLLFYTDGLNIWDATNTVMPNGSGLLGGPTTSAWDQALVFPRPYSPGQYYVFTCDESENGPDRGIRYSIVDMALNGGLGDVTDVKNVFLCPANQENMSAAYHADGHKVWLVIQDYDIQNTYLIDSTGIGPPIPFSDPNYSYQWTRTKFFNSGKRLMSVQYDSAPLNIVILDFDNENGTFSNPVEINITNEIWGLEVSPDDSKLYGSLQNNNNTTGLYQFDLSLTTGPAITNSKTLIGNLPLILSRLQLAPNGKIYQTEIVSPNMDVINNPNELGTDCNYVVDAIDLSPASNKIGLPKFIRGQRYAGINTPIVNLGPDQSICEGHTTVLNPEVNENYEIIWQDGSTDSTFTAWLPGTYWATASNECGAVTDSIKITLEQLDLVDLGNDINVCAGENIMLDAGTNGDFYLWQDGSNNSTFTATEPGVYWVNVSTQTGCYQHDSISIQLDTQAPIVECPISLDTLVPAGTTTILLNPGIPNINDSCPYTFVNNLTNTNDATANYPAGTTTNIAWTVTDADGNFTTCDMDVIVNFSTGIPVLENNSQTLMLYPNPSNGIFILEDTQNNMDDIQISIFDPLGRKIDERSVAIQGKVNIDLTDHATGVYFLQWSNSKNSGAFKLIINDQ